MDNHLGVDEEDLFTALLWWGEEECKRQNLSFPLYLPQVISDLLPAIRFPSMEIGYLSSKVAFSGLISEEHMIKLFQYVTSTESIQKTLKSSMPYNTNLRIGRKGILIIWDPTPTFTHNLYTISNKGRTATKSQSEGTIYVCRSTIALPSIGKHYWEIKIENIGTTNNDIQFGAAAPNFNYDSAWMKAAGTYHIDRLGHVYDGTNLLFSGSPGTINNNERLGFALNCSKRTLTVSRGISNMKTVFTILNVTLPLWPCWASRPVGTRITSM